MKLYLLRSLRYILRMVVILGMVFAVLAAAGMLETGGQGLVKALFFSRNGAILIGVLILMAGIYPKLAFTSVEIRADINTDRDAIIETFKSYGYSPAGQSGGRLVFRADKTIKKITSQFDDAITITPNGRYVSMEGLKKDVLRLQARLNAFLTN